MSCIAQKGNCHARYYGVMRVVTKCWKKPLQAESIRRVVFPHRLAVIDDRRVRSGTSCGVWMRRSGEMMICPPRKSRLVLLRVNLSQSHTTTVGVDIAWQDSGVQQESITCHAYSRHLACLCICVGRSSETGCRGARMLKHLIVMGRGAWRMHRWPARPTPYRPYTGVYKGWGTCSHALS
jgi:hypothetical protein